MEINNRTNCRNYFTFTFKFIFVINFIFFILSKTNLNTSDFSICEWPIYIKYQYYRILTHHFFHSGFIHFFLNIMFFFSICHKVEEKIGTAYLLIFIFQSILLVSIIYLVIIALLKFCIVTTLKFTQYDFNLYCSIGFSGILFSIYFILCSFKSVSNIDTYFFGLIPMKSKYSPYIYLLLIQMVNPNSSLIGHSSGIISGIIIKNVFVYFFIPGKIAIESFEEKFNISSYLGLKDLVNNNGELEEINKNILDTTLFKFILKKFRKENNVAIVEISNSNISINNQI